MSRTRLEIAAMEPNLDYAREALDEFNERRAQETQDKMDAENARQRRYGENADGIAALLSNTRDRLVRAGMSVHEIDYVLTVLEGRAP